MPMEKKPEEIPVLVFNSSNENEAAFNSVFSSGIPCEFVGTMTDENTPILFWEHQEYRGYNAIKRFVEEYPEKKAS